MEQVGCRDARKLLEMDGAGGVQGCKETAGRIARDPAAGGLPGQYRQTLLGMQLAAIKMLNSLFWGFGHR
jgi:hypothetical protein